MRFKITALVFISVSMANLTDAIATQFRTLKEVQSELTSRGFDPGSADGVWGRKSVLALKKFQRESGLEEKGTIDKPTLEKLFPIVDADTVVSQNSSGTAIITQAQDRNSIGTVADGGTTDGNADSSSFKVLFFGAFLIVMMFWRRGKRKKPGGGEDDPLAAKVEPTLNVTKVRSRSEAPRLDVRAKPSTRKR
ncbi:peptidoglycan-binding domain-containing protein [Brucella rhizosphaerae]|uniref:Putative peptidoglycan binding domain protein n=1 Tax=Brucella rhizosphaerae TaxID=571254 RepID=A0A256FPT0_9HYPH|nr:peptidoglycan-binding domain-containing protein [Brucella rhizosphaerae]OYR16837.1 putative peptidoglycan binding domain protein [Brucella rhizosphaerae]